MAAPWIFTEDEQRLLDDLDTDWYRKYHGHGWTSEMQDDMIAVQEQDATRIRRIKQRQFFIHACLDF